LPAAFSPAKLARGFKVRADETTHLFNRHGPSLRRRRNFFFFRSGLTELALKLSEGAAQIKAGSPRPGNAATPMRPALDPDVRLPSPLCRPSLPGKASQPRSGENCWQSRSDWAAAFGDGVMREGKEMFRCECEGAVHGRWVGAHSRSPADHPFGLWVSGPPASSRSFLWPSPVRAPNSLRV